MPKSLVLLFSFLIAHSSISHSSDPILNWINKNVSPASDIDEVWNPGFLPFDETQLRVDIDDKGKASEYSVRYSLKPLFGLRNEYRLSSQRKKIIQLEKSKSNQSLIFEAYRDLLLYWKTHQAVQVINNSEFIYRSAQTSLSNIKSTQNIDFDVTTFITNLADFNSSKTELTSRKDELKKIFNGKIAESKELINHIEGIQLINISELDKKINQIVSSQLNGNEQQEKVKLKFYEFEKKNRESKQLFKFLSVSQEAIPQNSDNYKFQVAFRIPFLSDSQELEKSKLDYIQSKQRLEIDGIKLQRDTLALISELKGLLEKENILRHLPEKSHNKKKFTSSVLTMSEAIKSENQFIKAKFDLIETRFLIFEKYLLLLSLNNQLESKTVNYLTALP